LTAKTPHTTDPDATARPLVAVVGPTGSGKSDLDLLLAEKFNGEIVNCDSLQVYRHFDVGTAKLPPAERRGIPHHLIDILNPDELFTAGEYARVARHTIREISGRGRLPTCVERMRRSAISEFTIDDRRLTDLTDYRESIRQSAIVNRQSH